MTGYLGRFAMEFRKTLAENHMEIVNSLEPSKAYEVFDVSVDGDSPDYIPVGTRIMVGTAMVGYAILYTASQGVMLLLNTPRMIKNAVKG